MNQHKTLTLEITSTVDRHTLQFGTYDDSSPMHTMLAALGMCSLMTLHGICQRQRQHVIAYRAELSAQQRTTHPQILQHIQLHFVVIGHHLDLTRLTHAVELLPKYCPVHAMMAHASTITHSLTIQEKEAR